MENIEIKDNKVVETLTKELESLSAEGLHEFFKFFYKMNHTQNCMISTEQFEEFLKAWNPPTPQKRSTNVNEGSSTSFLLLPSIGF